MKANVMRMVMGVVIIVVAVILMPIELTAVSGIVNDTNIATFTGVSAIAKILPLVILVLVMFSADSSAGADIRVRVPAKAI